MELMTFRENATKIEDQWLGDNSVKLRKARKSTGVNHWAAYKEGAEDSKKIDVHRKANADVARNPEIEWRGSKKDTKTRPIWK
ncbi:hypothetical protein DOTSEDRAFT_27064 [Dothistroma septosporum NZE10]|uniref:Uncharacterized protein n=1 Tax=Dothistroma septosporum (strain NZE10 / CBS 128990) TaxID=675120 RepID=N1PE69_DOTSN|nr:hypothetical protein DOTSEDRAFT_27064 [Dothistroma septosporum NZE10]